MTAEVVTLFAAEPTPAPAPDPAAIISYLRSSRMYHTYTALRLRKQIREADFFDGDDRPVKQWREWFSHHVKQVRRFAKAERNFRLGRAADHRQMAHAAE